MNFLRPHQRQRHRSFDNIQSRSLESLASAEKADYILPEEASDLARIIGDSFAVNVRGDRAEMPLNKKGSIGTAILPLIEIGDKIDVRGLMTDIPMADREKLDSDELASLREEWEVPKPQIVSIRKNVPALCLTGQRVLCEEETKDWVVIPGRSVIVYDRRVNSSPGMFVHEISHVQTGMWPFSNSVHRGNGLKHLSTLIRIQEVCERTYSERRAYGVQYGVQHAVSADTLPRTTELVEVLRDYDPDTAAGRLRVEINKLNKSVYREAYSSALAAMILTQLYGPTATNELPTPQERVAYKNFGLT